MALEFYNKTALNKRIIVVKFETNILVATQHPRTSTNPTSQILEIKNRLFLSIVENTSAASQK
jgi:hypothetical protein